MQFDSTSVAIAAIAAIPPTIAAIATLFSQKKTRETVRTTSGKVDEVHNLCNGNLDKLRSDLAQAQQEITDLKVKLATGATDSLQTPQDLPQKVVD